MLELNNICDLVMNYSRTSSGLPLKPKDVAEVVFHDTKCCQTEEEEVKQKAGFEDNWTQTEGGWSRLERHR